MKLRFQDTIDWPEAAELVKTRTQISYLTVLSSIPYGLPNHIFLLAYMSLKWAFTSTPGSGYTDMLKSIPKVRVPSPT